MRVLVCVKRVPAPGAKINLTADGRSLDTAFLGFTTSPHEECGVEAAVQLIEAHGGSSTVLTVGPAEAEEQLRYAVSMGVDAAALVATDASDWDPQRTARAVTAAIQELESTDGPFDVIIFGNESADSGGYQVGVRAAYALGRPIVNGIKGIDVEGSSLRLRRESDAGMEVYELAMPCVIGVKEGVNLPRYPTMKGRLASKKAAVVSSTLVDLPGGQEMVVMRRPAEVASSTVILGTGPEAAAAVVDMLEEIGVLK